MKKTVRTVEFSTEQTGRVLVVRSRTKSRSPISELEFRGDPSFNCQLSECSEERTTEAKRLRSGSILIWLALLAIAAVVVFVVWRLPAHSQVLTNSISAVESPTQTFIVVNADSSGPGSLQQAITSANSSPGLDTITFNIPASGIQFIFLNAPLPTITDSLVIDGTTQPGYTGTPLIHLEGLGTGQALNITAGGSTIKGLSFTSFFAGATNGIVRLATNGNNVITGCNFGVRGDNTRPTTAATGIVIDGSNDNRIGGLTGADRNYFVIGSEHNLVIQNGAANNRVVGNWFGTGPNGVRMSSFGRDAIRILNSPSNTIGGPVGTTPGGACTGECNVIAGAGNNGILISGAASTGNRVIGSFVGLFPSGTSVNQNNLGIRIDNAPGNAVGGTTAGERNVITGNDGLAGVHVTGAGSTGTVISGNYIGLFTNGTGTPPAATATADGILLNAASTNTRIGGTLPGERNVISGLRTNGIEIAGSNGNFVLGNYIGTDATGMVRSTTLGNGISVQFSNNNTIGNIQGTTLGGPCTGACNVISGNGTNGSGNGITLNTANNNTIDGNYIGWNATGLAAILNGRSPEGMTFNGNAIFVANSNNNIIGNIAGPSAPKYLEKPRFPAVPIICVEDDESGNFIKFDVGTQRLVEARFCAKAGASLTDLPGEVTTGSEGQLTFLSSLFQAYDVRANVYPGGLATGSAHFFHENRFIGFYARDTNVNDSTCMCDRPAKQIVAGKVKLGESGANAANTKIVDTYIGKGADYITPVEDCNVDSICEIDFASGTTVENVDIGSCGGSGIIVNNGTGNNFSLVDFTQESPYKPIFLAPGTNDLWSMAAITIVGSLEGSRMRVYVNVVDGPPNTAVKVRIFGVNNVIQNGVEVTIQTDLGITLDFVTNGQGEIHDSVLLSPEQSNGIKYHEKFAGTLTKVVSQRPSDDSRFVEILGSTSEMSIPSAVPVGSATPTTTPTSTPTSTPTATPTATPSGFESDMAPRFTGDGNLLSNDVTLVRQFVVGSITPELGSNEFQRADAAPLASRGDGLMAANDVVQARRYVVGLDPANPAAGPTVPAPVTETVLDDIIAYFRGRELRAGSASARPDDRITIPIEITAIGDETAVSWTLEFDPSKLSNPRVGLAPGLPDNVVLTINDGQNSSGRIGVLIDSAGPFVLIGGKVTIITITFDVAPDAALGGTAIRLTSSVAPRFTSDSTAEPLLTHYLDGEVVIK